jgi:DNA-binding IclR family transcriptional regulator
MALTLEEFSDRELLFALEEHADGDGLVSSQALAEGLGLVSQNGFKHPGRNVAVRLSWLKRYGVVHRDDETHRWGLTPVGYRLMHGSLRKAENRMLEDIDDERMFAVMERVGSNLLRSGDEAATMVARHWRYSMAARKRTRIGRR